MKKYAGQPIENVPEEYREKIATLRQYGLEPKPKRTSKEIVRATMGSLTDQKMADDVYGKLQEQVEKVKEGGVNIGEQS